jgi:hypothetical protein
MGGTLGLRHHQPLHFILEQHIILKYLKIRIT